MTTMYNIYCFEFAVGLRFLKFGRIFSEELKNNQTGGTSLYENAVTHQLDK